MKCQKSYSRVHVKSCTSALIREALETSSASASKNMAENFTLFSWLFAIEEEIAVQMPKNSAKRAKLPLDEWQLLFEEYVVDQ